MAASVDDIMESVANGVLRALDARSAAVEERGAGTTADLVGSGFNVSMSIVCGGLHPWPSWERPVYERQEQGGPPKP